MITAAIAGLGRWGKNITESVQGKSARLRIARAIVRNPASHAEFARKHSLELGADFGAAIADPAIDAVILTTPHSLHLEQILAAAAAGKHVFCEKPLTLTRADSVRAVEACERAGRVLAVGYNKRFAPSVVALKEIVASGRLGQIQHVEGHNSNAIASRHFAGWRRDPHESPAGAMTATGVHALDAMGAVAGPVAEVSAQLVTRRDGDPPRDAVSALMRFAGGASGTLTTVRVTPQYWRIHVFGDEGSAESLSDTALILRSVEGEPERRAFPAVDTLHAEIDAFAAAIAGEAPYPMTHAEMIATSAAFEAIVRSIDARMAIRVE